MTYVHPPPLRPSDPVEIEHVLWRGWSGFLAFDIGARCGENFDNLTASGFRKIIALEPQPDSFAQMKYRFGHREDIDMRQVAVSGDTGPVLLAEVPGAISKGEWVTSGTNGMEWSLEDWSTAVTHEVRAVTLDDLSAEAGVPDFVVIDTEGHEGKVLDGASLTLAKRHTGWLIEFHTPELHTYCSELLEQSGHLVETVRHPHYPHGSAMWHQHGWIRAVPAGQEDPDDA